MADSTNEPTELDTPAEATYAGDTLPMETMRNMSQQ